MQMSQWNNIAYMKHYGNKVLTQLFGCTEGRFKETPAHARVGDEQTRSWS